MKVTHIISTFGVILGGLAIAQGANATVSYKNSTDVQFTFNPSLGVALTGDFTIDDLVPNTSDSSDAVSVTVTTNSASGYELSATVGNGTSYTGTALTSTSHSDTFSMISTDNSALTSGTWGYVLGSGTTYSKLPLYTQAGKTLNKTTNSTGTAASGYTGGNTISMKIGAYAKSDQRPGTYNNVINFTAVSNVVAYNLTLWADSGVSTVAIGGNTSTTSGSYSAGDSVSISATCQSGKSFSGWTKSVTDDSSGSLTSASSASTTYTMGSEPITLTASCS